MSDILDLMNPREVQGQQSGPLSATQDHGILRGPLKFPEIPIQAPKTPESLSLPDSQWNTFIPFCGLLYSSPDVPTRPELLPAYPTSCLNTPLPISRHKTSEGFLKDSLLASQSTLNCRLISCSFSSHSSF